MASADLRAELTCPICTDIYTDPVTLTCGHNYCQKCITRTWDNQDEREYSCPECRHRFRVRPDLRRNLRLRNIAESFRLTPKEREEVGNACTRFTSYPVSPIKISPKCEDYLCGNHLKLNKQSAEHVLSNPTTPMGNKKCSVHQNVLEYYCCEDSTYLCVYCVAGEHRGHLVESLTEASEKKKEKLVTILGKLTSEREEAEEKVQSLQELKRQVEEKVAGITEGVTSLIRAIREKLEALEMRVLSEISRQEEQVSLRVSDLIQQLEIKKEDLSRKMGHIEELCNMTDPLTVLQGRESDRAEYIANKDEEDDKVHSVGDLDMGLISMTLHEGLTDMVMTAKRQSDIVQTSDLLLDINTASNYLTLSGDLKTVSFSIENKQRPDRPERFADDFPCVLSTRGFSSGRCYWVVEVSKSRDWGVGMAYPSIGRKAVGDQVKSWGVVKFKHAEVASDNKIFCLPRNISCRRLGIYLDYEVGRLSFYNLRDPISHLHTFTATFTEPLLFQFSVSRRGWVRLGSSDYCSVKSNT